MTAMAELESLDRLLDPVGDCFTDEVAARIVNLRADARVQSRLEDLAERNAEGTITSEEKSEYSSLVSAGNLISILQAKARVKLARG